MLNEQNIRQAVDHRLSGLTASEARRMRIRAATNRERWEAKPLKSKKLIIAIALVAAMLMSAIAVAEGLNLFDFFGKEDARYAALAPKATLEITEPALIAHPYLGNVEVKIDSAYFDGLSLTLAYRVSNSYYAEEYIPTEEECAQMRLDEPVILALTDNEPCLEVYEAYNEAIRNGTPFGYRQYSIKAKDHTFTDDGILLDALSGREDFDGAAFCDLTEFKSPLPDEIRNRDALTVTKKVYQHECIVWFDGKDCWLSSSIKDIGIITATIPKEKNQVKTFSGTGVIDGVECTFMAEVSPLAAVLTMAKNENADMWCDFALIDQNGKEYQAHGGVWVKDDKTATVTFDGTGDLPTSLTAYAIKPWEGKYSIALSNLAGVKLTPIE